MINAELLFEITVQQAGRYIVDAGYGCQEKENGKRRIAVRQGEHIYCLNRTGEPRKLPAEIVAALRKLPGDNWVLDGELCWLERAKRGSYRFFDLLCIDGKFAVHSTYDARYQMLQLFVPKAKSPLLQVVPMARTQDEKMALIAAVESRKGEGVVFKKLNAPYREGNSFQHPKLKFWKTLEAVVLATKLKNNDHDSVDVGVYLNGKLHRICAVSLLGKQRVQPGDVVEIKYLYGTPTLHVVQPELLHKRDDKRPEQCTADQIVVNAELERQHA